MIILVALLAGVSGSGSTATFARSPATFCGQPVSLALHVSRSRLPDGIDFEANQNDNFGFAFRNDLLQFDGGALY